MHVACEVGLTLTCLTAMTENIACCGTSLLPDSMILTVSQAAVCDCITTYASILLCTCKPYSWLVGACNACAGTILVDCKAEKCPQKVTWGYGSDIEVTQSDIEVPQK